MIFLARRSYRVASTLGKELSYPLTPARNRVGHPRSVGPIFKKSHTTKVTEPNYVIASALFGEVAIDTVDPHIVILSWQRIFP